MAPSARHDETRALTSSLCGRRLYRIAVVPQHRRRGIATALLREAESSLWARGAARIDAVVVASDDHALEFWKSAGYERRPTARGS